MWRPTWAVWPPGPTSGTPSTFTLRPGTANWLPSSRKLKSWEGKNFIQPINGVLFSIFPMEWLPKDWIQEVKKTQFLFCKHLCLTIQSEQDLRHHCHHFNTNRDNYLSFIGAFLSRLISIWPCFSLKCEVFFYQHISVRHYFQTKYSHESFNHISHSNKDWGQSPEQRSHKKWRVIS